MDHRAVAAMSEKHLSCVELEPTGDANAAVIWLHGLGASGDDFVPAVPYLNLPDSAAVRFIFPHAPVRPVTVNNGWPMPAWYDILSIDIERKIDTDSLLLSVEQINALISREIERGIAPERIVLAGFSQGGAVAYHTALCYPQPLAGLVVLSTYIATGEMIQQQRQAANNKLPIWLAHGAMDDVVPFSLGEQAVLMLQQMDYEPEWHSYPIAHEVSPEELAELGHWLIQILELEEVAE